MIAPFAASEENPIIQYRPRPLPLNTAQRQETDLEKLRRCAEARLNALIKTCGALMGECCGDFGRKPAGKAAKEHDPTFSVFSTTASQVTFANGFGPALTLPPVAARRLAGAGLKGKR